jgi:hypothetical protein
MKPSDKKFLITKYFLDQNIDLTENELNIIPNDTLNKIFLFCVGTKCFTPLFGIFWQGKLIFNLHKKLSERKLKLNQARAYEQYKLNDSFESLDSTLDCRNPPPLPIKKINRPKKLILLFRTPFFCAADA